MTFFMLSIQLEDVSIKTRIFRVFRITQVLEVIIKEIDSISIYIKLGMI